jgi:hypothetical protein
MEFAKEEKKCGKGTFSIGSVGPIRKAQIFLERTGQPTTQTQTQTQT